MSLINDLIAKSKEAESKSVQSGVLDGTLTIEQLTYGPEANNLGGKYVHGKGAWDIKFVDKLSPDIILLFASRMAQMYLQTDSPNSTRATTRRVKDVLVKEHYPVHQIPQQ